MGNMPSSIDSLNSQVIKKQALIIIFTSIVISFLSSCTTTIDSNSKLPHYFYQTWGHSYEGKSAYNSTFQIYRPKEAMSSLAGYTMRYKFNKDGSCLFWALKQYDEYKMETCNFHYKSPMIYINDTSSTGSRTLTLKPLKIIELTPKKLVMLSEYKLP